MASRVRGPLRVLLGWTLLAYVFLRASAASHGNDGNLLLELTNILHYDIFHVLNFEQDFASHGHHLEDTYNSVQSLLHTKACQQLSNRECPHRMGDDIAALTSSCDDYVWSENRKRRKVKKNGFSSGAIFVDIITILDDFAAIQNRGNCSKKIGEAKRELATTVLSALLEQKHAALAGLLSDYTLLQTSLKLFAVACKRVEAIGLHGGFRAFTAMKVDCRSISLRSTNCEEAPRQKSNRQSTTP